MVEQYRIDSWRNESRGLDGRVVEASRDLIDGKIQLEDYIVRMDALLDVASQMVGTAELSAVAYFNYVQLHMFVLDQYKDMEGLNDDRTPM